MVYDPAEDTYFFKQFLENLDLEGKKVLEIGTGNGLLAVTMAENGAEVTASDIDQEALKVAEELAEDREVKNQINFVHSDMFEGVVGEFDIIIFNPPYLPGDYNDETKDWAGGKEGVKKTLEFIKGAKNQIKLNGDIYFIASSGANLDKIHEAYNLGEMDSKKIWFETLYIYRV